MDKPTKSKSLPANKEGLDQKEIWYAYINAKKKYTDRLAQPIEIKPESIKLERNWLNVEVNQKDEQDEIIRIIKKYFPIPDENIHLNDSYFLVPNNIELHRDSFDKFQEETKNYYLDFRPFPVLEGFIEYNESETSKFFSHLKSLGIDPSLDWENRINVTLEQIEIVDEAIKSYNEIASREDSVACIFDNFRLLNVFQYFRRIADFYKRSTNVFKLNEHYLAVTNYLHSELEENTAKEAYGAKFEEFKIRLQIKSPSKKDKDLIDSILSKYSPYKVNRSFAGSLYFLDINYLPSDHFSRDEVKSLINDVLNSRLEVSVKSSSLFYYKDELPSKGYITVNLPRSTFSAIQRKNFVSFDFKTREELEEKRQQLYNFKPISFYDRQENQKYKLKLNIQNPFDEIINKLTSRFPNIQTKPTPVYNTLKVRYFYQYNPENDAPQRKFLDYVEREFREGKYIWKEKKTTRFDLKFFAEVNHKLKEFEQNSKFSKILGSEIKIGRDRIGVLANVEYPWLYIKLNPEVFNLESLLVKEQNIVPDLTGEREKDARLEDALNKLVEKSKSVVNPNLCEFIFDSATAQELSDPTVLLKGSKEWEDVIQHKNPKSNLNDSQIRGIISSLYAKDLAIIQGPPGTGKSTAISEIVWHHIRKKNNIRILLTSESHLAVDNALDKLTSFPSSLIKPIRFGIKEDFTTLNDLDEIVIDQRVENEGKRFGLDRIKAWADQGEDHPQYETIQDNAARNWLLTISNRANNQIEEHPGLKEQLVMWKSFLDKPEKKTKQLVVKNYIENVNVIGSTSSSIAEKMYSYGTNTKASFLRSYEEIFKPSYGRNSIKFDVVITDEASKATPPELAIPLIYGKKSIIVGDHRQLPPSLDEDEISTTLDKIGEKELARAFKNSDMNESQFQRLFEGLSLESSIRTTFNQQYRMHSSINNVISQFYEVDGGLFCGLDPQQENIPDLSNPQSRWHGLTYGNFLNPDVHCIWVDVRTPEILEGDSFSRVNWGEIEACRKVLNAIKNATGYTQFINHWDKEEEKEIGVISFYGAQVGALSEMAEQEFSNMSTRVKTVDKFQGMERNILLVSMVRSNIIASDRFQRPDLDLYPDSSGYEPQSSLGFADVYNRLNVGLSRAKRLLIIIGNSEHFCKVPMYKKVFDSIQNSKYGKIVSDIQNI